jgi:selenocysteine-specific elongation factor
MFRYGRIIMEHLIIGTAGHVDHGKTELVKALTGHDTDRLKEEKIRGMTIELGFAPFYLDGKLVSIVDVPGHEKLIKTMVSGATGMDMALLIIAADEGIMPQTIEHINILSMLDISSIIVVITKIDLISTEEKMDVIKDVKDYMESTPFRNSPICTVSSKNNIGIDELKNCIISTSKKINKKRDNQLFRMAIDRVFTIKGHGTVVTGTIGGGKIRKEDFIEILPHKILSRIKGIQVHGVDVDKALVGQRCAINLNKVEKTSIDRGNVIAKRDEIEPTIMIDTVIYNVSDKYKLKHNSKVRVNIGTQEVIGKLCIIGKDSVEEKQKGYVRIRLEKPIVAIRGDRFIIRSLTPILTVGGGEILCHRTSKSHRSNEQTLNYYELLDEGAEVDIILHILENENYIYDINKLFVRTYIEKQTIWCSLTKLVEQKKVIKLNNKNYISDKTYLLIKDKIVNFFQKYYKDNDYRVYISKEELRTKHFSDLSEIEFNDIIQLLFKKKIINLRKDKISINEKTRISRIYTNNQLIEFEKQIIESELNGINILKKNESVENNNYLEIIKFLEETKRIIKVETTSYIHINEYNKFIKVINDLFKQHEHLSVGQVRDKLLIGRKQTIILLEYLDDIGITKRIDNYRVLL